MMIKRIAKCDRLGCNYSTPVEDDNWPDSFLVIAIGKIGRPPIVNKELAGAILGFCSTGCLAMWAEAQ